MTIDETLELLDNDDEAMESYVLSKEIKVYLNAGHDFFHPEIKTQRHGVKRHGVKKTWGQALIFAHLRMNAMLVFMLEV